MPRISDIADNSLHFQHQPTHSVAMPGTALYLDGAEFAQV
jgi:hypothetical protein